jgi:haloacetate dehalogenase
MFDGFKLATAETGEVAIRYRIGGAGPPLLLLHGHPQTHVMWHKVAPRLAEHFTVVAADLRGYGGSSKPRSTEDHEPYSKRAMARDQVALMQSLGFERFHVAGHDRGGRAAYRMAFDHPARVERLAVLDILPTWEHYQRTDMGHALAYWHWYFLAQPYPVPERMISGDAEIYFKRRWPAPDRPPAYFAPEAVEDYWRWFLEPGTTHAICEDYRAGATVDYRLDEADRASGRRIACPLLALWGGRGELGRRYDVLAVWRDWAKDVSGQPIDCGHYLAEERPEETAAALLAFFRG